MKNALAILCCAAVVALTVPALADKVITVRSAPAEVVSLGLFPIPDGGVSARVCGQTTTSTGETTSPTCYQLEIGGAARTEAKALMQSRALPVWVQKEGL